MTTAHASFRADLVSKGYETGMQRIESVTKASTSRMQNDFQRVEKSANSMRLGQISMQAQDVAVSLQNGASAATVLAQQGSQIASIFGPTGMVVGGVLAVGAGIYSWVTNAKDANAEIKETMRLLGETQQRRAGQLKNASENSSAADRARMTGPRADIGLLKMEYEADLKRMEEEFRKEPFHRRDFAVQERDVAARTDRFHAERGKLYDAHEAEAEKKRAATEEKKNQSAVQELRDTEKQQLEDFNSFRKQQDADEKEAREGLAESIREADKVEKANTARNKQIASLQDQLGREQAKAAIQNRAAAGGSILEGAGEHLKSQDQRIAEREAGQAESRAVNREVSRRLDRADQHRRSIGSAGMSPEEREDLRRRSMDDVKTAKSKEKILAEIGDDNIEKIVNKINDLLAK